jgi:uncharacterized protein (DUF362 family)/Pyruvate/2-oxoacid:ferredoxin oxidoreductase delta subunit
VVLKTNLLRAEDPKGATTTHPAVVQAVAELVADQGAAPIIADSPGGPFKKAMLSRVYTKTGMQKVADNTAAELNWNFNSTELSFPEAEILTNMKVAEAIINADVVINLPKFKTHGLTKLTGAVKNMFGAVPGLLKAEYHLNMQQIDDFSDVLLDIALAVDPELTIMDGIVGMEGEGPSGGDAIQLNTLLISNNYCALDVVMAELAGVEPTQVPTIKAAEKRGLISSRKEVKLTGDNIEIDGFETPTIGDSAKLIEQGLPGPLASLVKKLLRPKPIFKDDKCIQCGVCIQGCPPEVISKTESGVEADLDGCIRCFCCQELCPEEAVKIHRPLLGRLLFGK